MKGYGKASGKFILLGEHFVVHEPDVGAIAFPLPELWCDVTIEPSEYPQYTAAHVSSEKQNIDLDQIKSLMSRAYHIASDALRLNLTQQPVRIHSKANFPISRGFGSSAAFSIALSRAIVDLRAQISKELKQELELADPYFEIARASQKIESLFHGNPSGVDTSTILTAKPIYFQKRTHLGEDNLISPLSNKVADFILIDSGARDSCEAAVKKITAMRNDKKDEWNRFCEHMKSCIQTVQSSLQHNQAIGMLAEAITNAHEILKSFSLSTPKIEELIQKSKSLGALAGKVSGAGGGGAVAILCRPGETQKITEELQKASIRVITTVHREPEGTTP